MANESFIKVNNKLVLVNSHPITINGSSSNLQENKAVTYTSNGTATITPDAGYDGLSSVDVTVNVVSVSTVTIYCDDGESSAFWLSPDGEFHNTRLNAGKNTIIVTQYSPIGFYNQHGGKPYDWYNMEDARAGFYIVVEDAIEQQQMAYIYYATDVIASITI